MNLLNCFISSFWFFLCFAVCSCSENTVMGVYGQDVTLPCNYDFKYHGKCEICWMRGEIPASGCGNEIIATDGDKVKRRTLSKYTLKGPIQKGDVSLTILNTTHEDSGNYGCRVHVPGLFNDIKTTVHLHLTEKPATKTTTVNPVFSNITEIVTEEPWLPVSTEKANFSNASLPVHNKNDDMVYNVLPGIMVSILLLVLLGLLAGYLIWKQKRKSTGTLITQQNSDSAIYNNLNSSVGLHNRTMAVENIYQLETENEYERWS
ncbi:hepatitis A virus cellular receptor 1 [Hoplias malabaricus]|uniref:hepatitis A virus cellular receptor 1 n=1 Tax=Hoplias malabaricus TaxID=27720 RepID=UPI0034633245